jgi:hypothetical protein
MPLRPHALERIPPQKRQIGYRHALRPHELEIIPPQNRQRGYSHASTSAMRWREFLCRTDKEDTGMLLRPHAFERISPKAR